MPSQRTLACRQNHAICSQIGIIKNTVSDVGDNWSSALLLPSDYPSSKSWRSPQYALGRALQGKPANHTLIPFLAVLSQASLGWLANSTGLVSMRDTHTR